MQQEKKFATGIYFNDKHEKAPEWVVGSISIKKQEFLEYLDKQETSEKGYVMFSIKRSKDGKPYIELDEWHLNKEVGNGF